MSSGDIRRVSRQDIQLVQNLIERCLQLYMNQKEVVQTLLSQAKIEPGFTELVWQKLEEQNQEFFKAYRVRLMLKNQIVLFNQLLEQQVQLMRETKTPAIAVAPQNGSGASTLNQLPFQYSSTARGDYSNGSVHPPNIVNGGPPLHQGVQIQAHPHVSALNTGRADIPTNVLPAEGHNMQLMNGMKGTTMKLEPDYLSASQFPFCSDGAFLSEQQPQIDDRSGASFSGGELSPDHLAEPLVDSETFGFLSQIPRNLSFSDLADQFNIDASEGPGRSAAFCVPEHNNFPGSPTGKCEGENKRLDAIAEGATYN